MLCISLTWERTTHIPHRGAALLSGLLATVSLGAPIVLATSTPASAAEETCFGEAATIVGSDRNNVRGTAGDDVIVTSNVDIVKGRGGNDSICATHKDFLFVAGGGGDDRVDAQAMYNSTDLGPGDDEFVGGPGSDAVETDTWGDDGRDVVRSGAGSDTISTGHLGSVEGPIPVNQDDIDAGAGNDLVELSRSAPARLYLGAGRDELRADAEPRQRLEVDNLEGRITVDGRSAVSDEWSVCPTGRGDRSDSSETKEPRHWTSTSPPTRRPATSPRHSVVATIRCACIRSNSISPV